MEGDREWDDEEEEEEEGELEEEKEEIFRILGFWDKLADSNFFLLIVPKRKQRGAGTEGKRGFGGDRRNLCGRRLPSQLNPRTLAD